jgi:hypothetical protein
MATVKKSIEFTNKAIEKVLRTEVDKDIRFDFFSYKDCDGEEYSDWVNEDGMACRLLKIPESSVVTQHELLAMIDALTPYGIRVAIHTNPYNGTCLGFHQGR